jgi:hypothetical protein
MKQADFVMAGISCIEAFVLIPSEPMVAMVAAAAVHGPIALLYGDFGYHAVRDSVVTLLFALLVTVSCGYFFIACLAFPARGFRAALWGLSAFVYTGFPLAARFDPRPDPMPASVSIFLLAWFTILVIASLFGFALTLRSTHVA